MDKLSHKDLQSVDKRFGTDFVFDFEKSVELRTAKGGTSKSSVREQIQVLKGLLGAKDVDMSSDGGSP